MVISLSMTNQRPRISDTRSDPFLPRSRHEDPLEEDLGEVEHGDEPQQPGELEECVEMLGHLGVNTEAVLRSGKTEDYIQCAENLMMSPATLTHSSIKL